MQTKKCAHFRLLQLVHRWLPHSARQGKIEEIRAFDHVEVYKAGRFLMTLLILLLGLGVDTLVGLLGIGGGVVLVPAMVYLLHLDQHMAQGTSLFILLPPVGLGALREYWKQGQVDLRAGVLCALGMLLSAYTGSLVALPMESRNLKGLFGCFLMLAAFLLGRKSRFETSAIGSGAETARAVSSGKLEDGGWRGIHFSGDRRLRCIGDIGNDEFKWSSGFECRRLRRCLTCCGCRDFRIPFDGFGQAQ